MLGEKTELAGMPLVVKRASGAVQGCIFYLHGGGLIYGSPSDYPERFAQRFAGAGFDFLALGYPLAPEVTLDAQIVSVADALCQAVDSGMVDWGSLVAFGRSGGAFLWIAVMAELLRRGRALPSRFVSLYGYASLTRVRPWCADPLFRAEVVVPADAALGLIESAPIFDDPQMRRVLLYVFARQQGLTGQLLGVEESDAAAYDFEGRSALPPTFAAWSERDDDVSPASSQAICRMAKSYECFIAAQARHDFDQLAESDDARELIERLVAWLSCS